MYCSRCGENNIDTAKFCKSCGASLIQYQKANQMGTNAQKIPEVNQGINSGINLGMKWYKFIIYVQLFLLAISEIVSAIIVFTNNKYGDSTKYMYFAYSKLKTIDMIDCLLGLIIAVVAIYTRMQLAQFKKRAIADYLSLLIAQVVRLIFYAISFYTIIERLDSTYIAGVGVQIVALIVMYILNYIYFGKRKHYFVK